MPVSEASLGRSPVEGMAPVPALRRFAAMVPMPPPIAASVLTADFSRLGEAAAISELQDRAFAQRTPVLFGGA